MKDLTGMSTLHDIDAALSAGSFQPLVNVGNGLEAAEDAGDLASKVLSGTPGRIAAGFGNAAGHLGTGLSVLKAVAGMVSCMGG